MRRRDFLSTLGGVAAWPLEANAQQSSPPVIGFLGSNTPGSQSQWTNPFVGRLRELGWVEGRTIAIEFRTTEGRSERAAAIAAEFVRLKVDVIVTSGTPNVIAAKQAAPGIPIVFATAADPVRTGIVASLARPGGNVTGLSVLFTDLAGKRVELLREVVPHLRRLAILGQVGNPATALEVGEVQEAARKLGLAPVSVEFSRVEDIELAIGGLKGAADALYVVSNPLVFENRNRINTSALAARQPTMHAFQESAKAGGLMSYGANFPDLWRRAAELTDKILRGAKPAELPVEQPTKFDLTINLATAKALGLTVPPTLLARADEVFE